jgi:hypothetical protein
MRFCLEDMMSDTQMLEKITKARQMLEAASTVDEIKSVMNFSEQARLYAKRRGLELEAQNLAAEMCLDSTRKFGAALKKLERKEGRPEKLSIDGQFNEYKAALEETNTTRQDANRFEKFADIPVKVYEKAKEEVKAEAKELTLGGVVKVVSGKTKDDKRKQAQAERVGRNTPIDDRIIIGDMREVGAQIADNSIDLIFTDPPYPGEFLPLWGSLSELAARVLKPGGLCLAYSGQIFLPDTLRLLGQNLEYLWTFAIRHAGGNQRIFKVNVNTGWKPILCFVKPPLTIWWDSFIDITSGEREKDLHEWQQAESEAAYFIEKLCPAGGMVLDPFAGSGTTLSAAKKLGMKYTGIEVNPDDAQRATERLMK